MVLMMPCSSVARDEFTVCDMPEAALFRLTWRCMLSLCGGVGALGRLGFAVRRSSLFSKTRLANRRLGVRWHGMSVLAGRQLLKLSWSSIEQAEQVECSQWKAMDGGDSEERSRERRKSAGASVESWGWKLLYALFPCTLCVNGLFFHCQQQFVRFLGT